MSLRHYVKNVKMPKTPVKSKDFGIFYLVEATGLKPTVSSIQTEIFVFFDYYSLHIVRIFR